MRKTFTLFLVLSLFICTFLKAQELQHLSSYENNIEESAEVVAYDATTKRVFFTSSSENALKILDVSNPSNPVMYGNSISLAEYGAGPNSVAVYGALVAVAVESDPKTDNGSVVFFNTSGEYLNKVTVGALPDMITFTHEGDMLLVANEGEPSDDYNTDPVGSVSFVDLSSGVSSASVTTVDFSSYNSKRQDLLNKGVRVFGKDGDATVAEDMEPEYIAVLADDSKAYVSCQENNALAVFNISDKTLVDILPLGYKNHNSGTPSVNQYIMNELTESWPELGTPVYSGNEGTVKLGGFSGLFCDLDNSTDTELVFYTIPDRGPNDAAVSKSTINESPSQNLRPFKLPDYQSRIVKFTLNTETGKVTLNDQIMLTRADGTTPISGKGNIAGIDEIPVTYTDSETDYSSADYTSSSGMQYCKLPYDEFGGDFEGIVIDKNGKFWLCDEYRPAIYQFDEEGKLLNRYIAEGTSQLGDNIVAEGTYGSETLPAVFAKRWANRGFEAIAYDDDNDVIYAFIQSPLYNPSSETKNNSEVIRILGINAADGSAVSQYVYMLEYNKGDEAFYGSRVDKIGDACYIGDGKFMVIERDSKSATVKQAKKYIFEVNLNYATNIMGMDDYETISADLETKTQDEIAALGIKTVIKTKVVNIPSLGYQGSDKTEGLTMLGDGSYAIMNDNDFGLAGAGTTDNSVLGIISFADDYGFDASNKDDAINIVAHPTYGMYMPDGIASYNVDDVNYIVTANEGDSRDYDGYSEEERVKDILLDADVFSNAADLQETSNLGRLKTTTANGDFDGDGDFDRIYSYGARSFSIFDEYGNLVFDSGNAFELKVQEEEPDYFNEDDGEKDGRSDDKGVEPEAVAIGTIEGYTYAFIGCERQSAIIVYDVTDPYAPEFVDYYNDRNSGDTSPEIIKFITAANSPNEENLLLVGYEVSGSVGIIQVGGELTSISEELKSATFSIYPNPVSQETVYFTKSISGQVYDINGKMVKSILNQKRLNVSDLPEGVYIVKTANSGTKRFLKF